jgi:hypothetical protein
VLCVFLNYLVELQKLISAMCITKLLRIRVWEGGEWWAYILYNRGGKNNAENMKMNLKGLFTEKICDNITFNYLHDSN